jgi:hypothetical protein
LIQVKAAGFRAPSITAANKEAAVESPIILAGIILAFVVFGVALAYVDRIASRRPDTHPAE